MRLKRRRKREANGLARCRSANAAIEMAVIIPAAILLFVLLVEGSVQLLTAAALQYGLREATRFGITGLAYPASMSANPPASREAAIARIVTGAGIGLIKAPYLSVTLKSYSDFSVVGTTAKATAGAGGPNAVVQYQIAYFQPWLFSGSAYPPALLTGLAGFQFNLTTVVQNEPFPAN